MPDTRLIVSDGDSYYPATATATPSHQPASAGGQGEPAHSVEADIFRLMVRLVVREVLRRLAAALGFGR